ncbi:MAG: hypothetical protein ABIZ49_09505 [Opitutaceae bacterium]
MQRPYPTMHHAPSACRALALALCVFNPLRCLAADADPTVAQAPILLPSFIVSDTRLQWRYVATPEFELLSDASDATTTDLAAQLAAGLAVYRTLVPPGFPLQSEVPLMFILDLRDPAEVLPGALRQTWVKSDRPRTVFTGGGSSYRDDDLAVLYLNFHTLAKDARGMHRMGDSVARNMLVALLEGSAPRPPPWFLQATRFAPPLRIERREAQVSGILEKPVVPLAEVFVDWSLAAAGGAPSPADKAIARVYTSTLFVRWGLFADNSAHRDAYFKFVTRSALEPTPTETLFAQCFGFDYTVGLEKLKAFRAEAAKTVTIDLRKLALPPLAPPAVRDATDAEATRITAEWARLAARQNPQIDGALLSAAQRRLERGLEHAPHDPRLLAARGLLFLDQGDSVRAQPLLKTAIAANVVRPRAYLEVARLGLVAARAGPASADGKLSAAQIATILDPLNRAYAQSLQMESFYALTAQTWQSAGAKPDRAQLAPLLEGVRRFPHNLDLAFKSAQLHANHGYAEEAAALIRAGLGSAPDERGKERFIELQKTLPKR